MIVIIAIAVIISALTGCRTSNINRKIVTFQKDGKTPLSEENYYDRSYGWQFFSGAEGKSFLNPSFSVIGK